jgi:hypothetical protein
MRSLVFEGTEEGSNRWDILYGAMLVAPDGFSHHTRRVARRIIEKLEHLARPVEDPDPKVLAKFEFDKDSGPRELSLEEAEFKLLRETVDKIPWTRHAIVLADKTIEWMDEAKPSEVR